GNLFEAPQKISGAAISLKRRMPAAARRGENTRVVIALMHEVRVVDERRQSERGAPCPTSIVSKICWLFFTAVLPQKLTLSHSIVDASSMAFCQWALKFTALAMEACS